MKIKRENFMRRIIILALFAVFIIIPKMNVSAGGDIDINDVSISYNELNGSFFYLSTDDPSIRHRFEVTATINGIVYDGTISNGARGYHYFTVEYPIQKYGTEIVVKITSEYGESRTKTYTMNQYNYCDIEVASKDVKQTQIEGKLSFSYQEIIDTYGFSVVAKIGSKEYEGTVSGSKFTITYPKQEFGTKVTILVTDHYDGYTTRGTYKIVNHPPKLEVDKVYYNTTYITGQTAPDAEILVNTPDGKQYCGTSNSKGNFKVKIPAQKIKSKIVIGSNLKSGDYNSGFIIVKDLPSDVYITKDIFKNSSKITVTVNGGIKGDYITLKIGSKSYKKVIKNSKTQKVTFSIKNPAIGKKVTATLYNKFGQKRSYYNTEVYLADKPKVGMTKKQVLQTAWGSADYVDKFTLGGISYEQWGYAFSNKYIYLWFENGIVKSIDNYSY